MGKNIEDLSKICGQTLKINLARKQLLLRIGIHFHRVCARLALCLTTKNSSAHASPPLELGVGYRFIFGFAFESNIFFLLLLLICFHVENRVVCYCITHWIFHAWIQMLSTNQFTNSWNDIFILFSLCKFNFIYFISIIFFLWKENHFSQTSKTFIHLSNNTPLHTKFHIIFLYRFQLIQVNFGK